MALTKTTLASASYIQTTNAPDIYTPAGEAIVADGRLVPSYKVITPGVFSAGTVNEQSTSTAVPPLSNAQQP